MSASGLEMPEAKAYADVSNSQELYRIRASGQLLKSWHGMHFSELHTMHSVVGRIWVAECNASFPYSVTIHLLSNRILDVLSFHAPQLGR